MGCFKNFSQVVLLQLVLGLLTFQNAEASDSSLSDFVSGFSRYWNAQKLSFEMDGRILSSSLWSRNKVGPISVGSTVEKTVTVKNIGTSNYNLTKLSFEANEVLQIKDGSLSAQSIKPGESATFIVSIKPLKVGTHRAKLRSGTRSIFGTAEPVITVATVEAPRLVVYEGQLFVPSATSVAFGQLEVGKTRQKTFTLKNEGAADLEIQSAFIFSNQFKFIKRPSLTIAAGSSDDMIIEFAPTEVGVVNTALLIGSLTPSTTNYVIKMTANVIPAATPSALKVLDLYQYEFGATEEEALIPSTSDRLQNIIPMGSTTVGGARLVADYRLMNKGTAPITITSIKNIHPSESANEVLVGLLTDGEIFSLTSPAAKKSLGRAAKADVSAHAVELPFILKAGAVQDIRVEVTPNQNWIVRTTIQIKADGQTPPYEFNVSGAVAAKPGLACSADSNNFVSENFSCEGKLNGTICGATTDGKTKVCNQSACLLMGDVNQDGFVDSLDLGSFVKVMAGASLPTLETDLACSGNLSTFTEDQIEGFASLLNESYSTQNYNSRVIAMCTGRDLSNDPTRGIALVYPDGPINFKAMKLGAVGGIITKDTPIIYNTPVEACVDNLGLYDLNGLKIGASNGIANGKYTYTGVTALHEPAENLLRFGAYRNLQNDFRFSLFGDDGKNTPREAVMRAGAVQMYHNISNYRNTIMNDRFINDLKLDADIQNNLLNRQGRADLRMKNPLQPSRPVSTTLERFNITGIQLFPESNQMQVGTRPRTKSSVDDFTNLPPISLALDPAYATSDFAGLMFFWTTRNNDWRSYTEAFFGENDDWKSNVIPALSDGLSNWVAYRISGMTEIYRQADYMSRIWSDTGGCLGGYLPCDKGRNVRNVMIYDRSLAHPRTTFPYRKPTQFFNGDGQYDGPSGSDLSGLFFAALFYDLSKEAGLGDRKADLLFWKVVSMISDPVKLSMNEFGLKVLEAAAILFPKANSGSGSVYDDEIRMTLYSRGITLSDSLTIAQALPPAVRGLSGQDFASPNPNYQPDPLDYGKEIITLGRYSHPDAAKSLQLQFMKHSKLGPCDSLTLTDGTFDAEGNYNDDGSYLEVIEPKAPSVNFLDLGNRFVVVPGNQLSWKNSAKRCEDEFKGFYAEDLTSIGFRVVNVVADAMDIKLVKLGGDRFRVVSKSGAEAASYNVEIQQPGEKLQTTKVGRAVQLKLNEPLRLKITRADGAQIIFSDSLSRMVKARQ